MKVKLPAINMLDSSLYVISLQIMVTLFCEIWFYLRFQEMRQSWRPANCKQVHGGIWLTVT